MTEHAMGEAETLLRLLAEGEGRITATARNRVTITRTDGRGLTVAPDVIRALAEAGAVLRTPRGIALSPGGKDAGGAVPSINLAESPLALLATRRTRGGAAFLTGREVEAGEKLRSDYTRARIMPSLTGSWEAPVSRGRRAAGGSAADITDAALAARQRVEHAIEAVGPELSGVLIDVCCFLKGLERVEIERGWPTRSAKVVLKTALSALGRHYFPARPTVSQTPVLHWGAADYRPAIS